MNIKLPKYVESVLERLNKGGYAAYIVGGCVRDMILKRRPSDWDICTSATPEQLMQIFKRVYPTGIGHGTLTVVISGASIEVTTFRKEGEYIGHRYPKELSFTTDITEDLSRRDFTMNAIAYGIEGELCDPYGGAEDIEKGLIRSVGIAEERFTEDALRMLRAYRFSAKLGFTIEESTEAAIKKLSHTVVYLSSERIRRELLQVLQSRRPEVVGQMLSNGLLRPYIERVDAASTDFKGLSKVGRYELYRLTAFCAIMIVKGIIDSEDVFLNGLKYGKRDKKIISTALSIALAGEKDEISIKRYISEYGYKTVFCALSARIALGDINSMKLLKRIVRSGDCCTIGELAINGEHLQLLGFSGKDMGRILNMLLKHVHKYPEDNTEIKLRALAQNSDMQVFFAEDDN